jgi:hypothetical protein
LQLCGKRDELQGIRETPHSVLPPPQKKNTPDVVGFWTLSIVPNPKNWETRRFGNWICFRPQEKNGRKEERKKDIYSAGFIRKSQIQSLGK